MTKFRLRMPVTVDWDGGKTVESFYEVTMEATSSGVAIDEVGKMMSLSAKTYRQWRTSDSPDTRLIDRILTALAGYQADGESPDAAVERAIAEVAHVRGLVSISLYERDNARAYSTTMTDALSSVIQSGEHPAKCIARVLENLEDKKKQLAAADVGLATARIERDVAETELFKARRERDVAEAESLKARNMCLGGGES